MAITLTYSGTTLTLPEDLIWTDRDTWSPVEQTVEPSITGATIIDVAAWAAGRYITLEGDESHAWFTRTLIAQLKAWVDVPGRQMSLSIDGETFTVIFRHQEKPVLDVSPVVDYRGMDSADFLFGSIKFMAV